MPKLSEQLMNAQMVGDQTEIDRLKSDVETMQTAHTKKTTTDPIQVNTVLNEEYASAIKVYDFLNKSLGQDWWEWEFETIEQILWVKYGFAFDDSNRDKVMAIRHACQSDAAFWDWYEFNQLALAFSGAIADFEYLRTPSPGMAIATVKALNHIRPDREKFFGEDTLNYICVILINDGIYVPPPSIIELISKKMRDMVSEESSALWPKIYQKINDLANKPDEPLEENIVDIQARRVLRAEASALIYNE